MIGILRAVAIFGVLAAAGFGSYYGVRRLDDGEGAEARLPQATPAPALAQFEAARAADRLKPRIQDNVINGIHVGVDVRRAYPNGYCNLDGAPAQWTEPGKAAGTELEIDPGYLPTGAQQAHAEAVECGGVLVSLFKTYSLPDLNVIDIGRFRVAAGAERAWDLYGAAERIGPIVIAAKKGVVERPIMAPFDSTTIVLYEDFGITIVRADLPLEETVKIAKGLK